MQFLLLLSAIVAALSGAVSGRVVAPQQIESASSAAVETVVAEPAGIAVAIAISGTRFAIALRVVPLPRALAFARTIALYQERRRE